MSYLRIEDFPPDCEYMRERRAAEEKRRRDHEAFMAEIAGYPWITLKLVFQLAGRVAARRGMTIFEASRARNCLVSELLPKLKSDEARAICDAHQFDACGAVGPLAEMFT